MRFLSMIRIDETSGQVPSEQLMADMGKLIEELTRTGQLVSTAGLRPTSEGVRVKLHRDESRRARSRHSTRAPRESFRPAESKSPRPAL